MKSFFIKITVFVLVVAATLCAFYARFEMDFSDRFYDKFTHRSSSLVIGSSRALLGINPDAVSSSCPAPEPFLNFSFTQRTSPFGEVYFKAIQSKIEDGVTDGLFIIEVSPLSVSSSGKDFPEEKLILNEMTFFNVDPNFEYVARNSEHPLYLDVFSVPEKDTVQRFHSSGWLENVKSDTGVKQEAKINRQTKEYEQLFSTHSVSPVRLEWLEKIIRMISPHGRVILLRMPVTPKMMDMEQQYCPAFDTLMTQLADRTGVDYLNTTGYDGCVFTDLHHMTSSSATEYSARVGKAICGLNGKRN